MYNLVSIRTQCFLRINLLKLETQSVKNKNKKKNRNHVRSHFKIINYYFNVLSMSNLIF